MDGDLVRRAQSGDHEAFTALVSTAISRLHRTARLILRDDDRASDAVQDALTSAWLDIRALRDPERFEGWLNRLLVRACYREAGRSRRRFAVESRVAALEVPSSIDSANDLAIRDHLERGFRRLSPDQRAILVLHHYLGLRDQEAAEALGIPAGTVKSRLSRATSALRAALDADDRVAALAREVLA